MIQFQKVRNNLTFNHKTVPRKRFLIFIVTSSLFISILVIFKTNPFPNSLSKPMPSHSANRYSTFTPSEYKVVTGYFQQDDPSTNSSTFDAKTSNFGLLSNTSWSQLTSDIQTLNQGSPGNSSYKLFFFARHGEGFHNVAESFYGTPLWNCYWSLKDGNDTISWKDALLTEKGVSQANDMGQAWRTQLNNGAPLPQTFYSSPLTRAADTLAHTFGNISLHNSTPVFKEMIREGYGIHTCDERQNHIYLSSRYPTFTFESGFSDTDALWIPNYRESTEHINHRAHKFLNDIFANDTSTYISVTAHSGFLSSILSVLNHIEFPLSTGQMIPVLVKATRENMDVYDPTLTSSWASAPTCSISPTEDVQSFVTSV